MPTYIETDIFDAFEAKLSALVLSPALEIEWPNVGFKPPLDERGDPAPYLRASHLPGEPNQITLGSTGQNRHVGVFQVDVMWPEGEGIVAPGRIADAIVAHFKRGTDMTSGAALVRVIKPPSRAPAISVPPRVQIPVSIRYQVDAANPA